MDAFDGSFDYTDLVEHAVDMGGGQAGTAADVRRVRRAFQLLLNSWENRGFNTWRIKTISVAGRGPRITLPRQVDDTVQVSVANTDASETPLRRIGPQQYARLVNKGMQGIPAQYYLERGEPPVLVVYPTGRGRVERFSVQAVLRPSDWDRYGNALDVPSRWMRATVTGCALGLAQQRPNGDGQYNEELIARLSADSEQATQEALDADRQRTDYVVRIG